jgi:hypothetical protein
MSTAVMTKRMSKPSPNLLARMAGGSWFLCAATGTVALLAGGTLGSVANLAATLFYVAATLLVYDLLKPVNRNLSLVAALASLVGCALGILDMLAGWGVPFYAITSLFGLHCLLVGYLVLGSTFLPRFVGVLMVLAGLGWLAKSLAGLLALPFGRSAYLLIPGIVGEVTLSLWLLVAGVDAARWNEQAGGPGRSR